MIVTNKFSIDINAVSDYFWWLEIMHIFSLSGYYLTEYFASHPVHKYIGHWLIWILYLKSVKLFQENSHKNQTNSNFFHDPWDSMNTMIISHQMYSNSFILKIKYYWAYFLNARWYSIQYISNNILTIWNKMADLTDFIKRKCFLHMCKHQKVVSNKVCMHSVCNLNTHKHAV